MRATVMSTEVILETTVPVFVTVDLDEGVVTEVHVNDEAPMTYGEVAESGDGPATSEERQSAIDLAESEMWPAWEFGW